MAKDKIIVLRGPARAPGADPRARAGAELEQLRADVMEADPQQVRELREDPGVDTVAYSMPVRLIKPVAVAGAAAALAEQGPTWGIRAVKADASKCDGKGVTVAVLDTGIKDDHPAFNGVDLTSQKDFTGEGNGDRHGHGTHCAGTIFGRDVGGVRIGVARGVTKALIGKVLGQDGGGGSASLFDAIQWAISEGADVISMSLGFDFPGMVAEQTAAHVPADLATSLALDAYRANLRVFDALMRMSRARAAFGGGTVIVAAAGNESHREISKRYRIGASLPAAADDVVSVAAAGRRENGAYYIGDFSNSDGMLSGPGIDVVSASHAGGLASMSGTSMAAPHVAGLAALWWQSRREADHDPDSVRGDAVIAALRYTARPAEFEAGVGVIDRGAGMATAPG